MCGVGEGGPLEEKPETNLHLVIRKSEVKPEYQNCVTPKDCTSINLDVRG